MITQIFDSCEAAASSSSTWSTILSLARAVDTLEMVKQDPRRGEGSVVLGIVPLHVLCYEDGGRRGSWCQSRETVSFQQYDLSTDILVNTAGCKMMMFHVNLGIDRSKFSVDFIILVLYPVFQCSCTDTAQCFSSLAFCCAWQPDVQWGQTYQGLFHIIREFT